MIKSFFVQTKGHYDFINLTDKVEEIVKSSGVKEGSVLVFCAGSTVAVTTMEFEEGVKKDIRSVLEKIAPEDFDWEHHKKWGDHNGASHIKSALIGVSFVGPVKDSRVLLGAWQSIVLIDFDEKPRQREIIVEVMKSQ